ncbi:MAG TPA: efflux RND transporter periplasmic adaptor subunit [Caulobacteraceae bacterium]|jgi:cobalt-zinc-cadmium efflux system membrane fusion protein|nr:efflux RND transporter periplasmic adaptor subunit [Caulobacteraceae bacterium]
MTDKFLLPLALAALVAAAGLTGCSGPQKAPPSATPQEVTLTQSQRQRIRLFTVESSTFHDAIDVNGVVDFDNDQATSVIAPFSGPVVRLLASPGDHVVRGQVLALVESSDFSTAAATYRKAATAAANARRIADADKDLLAHQGVSAREATQAQTDAVGDEADLAAARQALVAMNVPADVLARIEGGEAISHMQAAIRAPIAGTVVERPITPGQLLQAGTTQCFSLADLSRAWVNAQLFGSDIGRVQAGDTAKVQAGDTSYAGRVQTVSAEVDPTTGAVAARVVLSNPAGVLKKQMYVRVSIDGRAASTGLLVPVSAILRDDEDLPFVYLATSSGGFARRRVTIGPRVGDSYDVTTGLQPGDRVVVDGAVFVQFMQDQ